MSWEQVKRIITQKLPGPNAQIWIEQIEVEENSKDGWRLGVCLAIDLESGALDPEIVETILNAVDPNETDARKAFGIAVSGHPENDRFICSSSLTANPLAQSDSYLRVFTIRNFMRFHVNPNNPHVFDPADVEDVRTSYFEEGATSDLTDIEGSWTGGNGIVWVMSYNDFLELTRGKSREEKGTLINDALGLNYGPSQATNDGNELVAVKYPPEFSNTCLQPTTLDADWRKDDGFYLSYLKKDGWGRTQSCSGNEAPIRERVHKGLDGLSVDYVGLTVGPIGPLTPSRANLQTEAYRRLAGLTSQEN
jgi:hypothetical protein